MPLRLAVTLLLGLALAFTAGCTAPLTPQDVADRFWRAVITGHPAKIRRYVLTHQRAQLEGDAEILAVGDYELGRVVIDGPRADIETTVTLAGDTPVPVTVSTRLAQEDGTWRVDYEATVAGISAQSELARVIGQIGELGNTLRDGLEQSVEEMSKALPAIERELSQLEARIRQRMPELRAKIEQFARQLERSLEQPPAAPAPEAPPGAPPEGETIAL